MDREDSSGSPPASGEIPPELTQPPRRVRPTAAWWAQRVVGWVGPGLLLVMIAAVWLTDAGPIRQLASGGRVTTGEVAGLRVVRGKSTTYKVEYRFRDEAGVTHEARSSVRHSIYSALREGGPVEVAYLPERPQVSRPWRVSAEDARDRTTLICLLLGITVPLGAAIAGLCEWDTRKHYALAQRGDVAVARVTSARKVQAKGGPMWVTTYTFQDGLGREQAAKGNVSVRHVPEVREGTPLTVLYLRERPEVSLPYAALMVRVVG